MAYKKWTISQIPAHGKVSIHTNGNGHPPLEFQLIDGCRRTRPLKQTETVFTKEGEVMKPWKIAENNHNLFLEDDRKDAKVVAAGAILYTQEP